MSYWASAVARTSGRGHVAEVKTIFFEVFGILNQGFPISSLLGEV